MKYIICALAMMVLAASSCKSKPEPEIAKEPEIVKENPKPEYPSKHPEQHSNECDKCHHHGHKKKIPPGHAKKMHGDQSARNYAPGHHKKH